MNLETSKMQHQNEESERSDFIDERLKVCRVCLETETKLYPMSEYQLKDTFQHFTGIMIDEEDRLPRMLCVECARRLCNYSALRSRSIRADRLLRAILHKQQTISLESITLIDRHKNELSSNITIADCYNIHIIEDIEPEVKYYNCSGNEENYIKIEYDNHKEVKLGVHNLKCRSDDNEANHSTILDKEKNPRHDFESKKVIIDKDVNKDNIDDITVLKHRKDLNNDPRVINEVNKVDLAQPIKLNFDISLNGPGNGCSIPELMKKEKKPKEVIARSKPTKPKTERRRRPMSEVTLKLYDVKYLSFDEQNEELLKRKLTAHYKKAPFKCESCYKGFNSTESHDLHMVKHSDASGTFVCGVCKVRFKSKERLGKHTNRHLYRYKCKSCDFVTTYGDSIVRHRLKHEGKLYPCPQCPREFINFTSYMGHRRINHPSSFVCQLCGFSFVSEKGITHHKKLKHAAVMSLQIPENGPNCELCNIKFASAEAYNNHLRISNKHSEGKKSRNEYIVRQSRKRNTVKDETIKCERCGVVVDSFRSYYHHFKVEHPGLNRTIYPSDRQSMCDLCGRLFHTQKLMEEHRVSHTRGRQYKCDAVQCGKSFNTIRQLKCHKSTHDKQMKFQCNDCGKFYTTKNNLQRHIKLHSGVRPFSCDVCGKTYTQLAELKVHILHKHMKVPWPKKKNLQKKMERKEEKVGDK